MPPLVHKTEEDKIASGVAMPCPVNAEASDQKKSSNNTKLVSCYRSSGSISVPQTPSKNFVTFQLVKASSSTFDSLKEELRRRRSGITTKKRPAATATGCSVAAAAAATATAAAGFSAKEPLKKKAPDAAPPPEEGRSSAGIKGPDSEAAAPSLLAGALLNAVQVAKAITDFEDSQTARADSRNSENSDKAQTTKAEAEGAGPVERPEREEGESGQLHKQVSDCGGNDSLAIRIEQGKQRECDRASKPPILAENEEETSRAATTRQEVQEGAGKTLNVQAEEKERKKVTLNEKGELQTGGSLITHREENLIQEATCGPEKDIPKADNKLEHRGQDEMPLNPEKAADTKAEDLFDNKGIGTKNSIASPPTEEEAREANGETAQIKEEVPPCDGNETEIPRRSCASSRTECRRDSGSISLALSHADSTWLEVGDEAARVTRVPTMSELSRAAQSTTEACESASRLDAATKPIIRLCHPDEAASQQKSVTSSSSSCSASSAIDENALQLQLLRSTTRRPPASSASTRRRSSATLRRFSRSLSSSSEASTCAGSDSDQQQDADGRRKRLPEEVGVSDGDDGVAARSCGKHSKCHCYLFALDTLGLYSIVH